jgi:hypothetical protein
MENPVNGFPIKDPQTDSSKFAEQMETQLSEYQNYTKQTRTNCLIAASVLINECGLFFSENNCFRQATYKLYINKISINWN